MNLKLLDKIRGKKNIELSLTEVDYTTDSHEIKRSTFFDMIGLNGHDIPANIRDIGYQSEGAVSDYPFRSFILEFGATTLTTGALETLYRAGAVNVTFYMTKLTKSQAVRVYKSAATDEGARLVNMLKSGNDLEAADAQKSMEQAKRLLDEISDGYNDGFLGTCVATVYAPDEKTLDNIGMIIQDDLIGNDHNLRVLYDRQRDGWLSTLPIGNNRLNERGDRRFFERTSLVAASPFYSSKIPYSGGVPIGINKHTYTMEFLNVFAKYLDSYTSVIVGASGSGKSFSNKYITSSQVLLGYRIFSIDPDGENGPVCRLMGGREVEIREGSNVCINVCAVTEEEIEVTQANGRRVNKVVVPLGSKSGQLLKFYDKLAGGLSSEEKAVIKKAIMDVYTEFGINDNPDSLYENEKVPFRNEAGGIEYKKQRKPEMTLTDIYRRIMMNCTRGGNLETYQYEEITDPFAARLLKVLRSFLRDYPDGKLLDGQTNFDDGKPIDNMLDEVCWINFNIKPIEGSDIYDLINYVIYTLGWEYFIKRPSLRKYRKRVKAEEAWRLKRIPGGMEFVEDMGRRSRKYNGGIDIITQDLTPFLDDPNGIAVVKNATTALFLRIGQIATDEKQRLKSIFNFSEGELDIICRRPPESEKDDSKGEGILRVGGSSAYVKVTVSDEMRKFIDTDPDYLQTHGLLPEVEIDEVLDQIGAEE
ncbi:hypothetical protein [Paenibacillus sp. GP183]|uniref:VirB4 family type IV secretion system protein n=1 Tax=Paenibacillus sp. GP183 TaxID=1882751 RepID=UPI0008959C46|nr:hypothetical protein [Paenibacillus sp. GP183]SED06225.1 hypothetical protein SAMN05443246_5540 [Paenibacillus sp. GP183]SED14148.1 hypothetical protein SAMN05443246_5880 [Paenibacillus sp. GP183]